MAFQFDESTAKLEGSPAAQFNFDESTARLEQAPKAEEQDYRNAPLMEQIKHAANDPLINKILAAGGGIQKGIVNIAKAIPDAGIFDPVLNTLDPEKNAPDFVKQEMINNPGTSFAGEIAGSVLPAAGVIGAVGKGLSSLGTIAPEAAGLLNNGFVNSALANSIAGALIAGTDNRTTGAVLGGAIGAVGSAVGAIGKKIINSKTVGTKLKNIVNDINQRIQGNPDTQVAQSLSNLWETTAATENQLFNSFKNVKGHVDAAPVVYRAGQILTQNSDTLTPQQQSVLQDIMTNASKAKDLADLHDARKIVRGDWGLFNTRETPSVVKESVRDLFKTFDSAIENNAVALGAGAEFRAANEFYKTKVMPLMDIGLKDINAVLKAETTNPATRAKIVDGLISRNINVNKPESAKLFIENLDDSSKDYLTKSIVNKIIGTSDTNAGFAQKIKTINDYQVKLKESLPQVTQDTLEGMKKLLIQGKEIKEALAKSKSNAFDVRNIGRGIASPLSDWAGLTKFINSPTGQRILIEMGREGSMKGASDIMNAMLLQGTLGIIDKEVENNG